MAFPCVSALGGGAQAVFKRSDGSRVGRSKDVSWDFSIKDQVRLQWSAGIRLSVRSVKTIDCSDENSSPQLNW